LNGTPLNIVEMGLIREVAHDGDSVRVRLLLTDPFCPYFLELMHRVEHVLTSLPGVQHIRFEASDDMLWTPERLAAAARERLVEHRAVRFAQLEARPSTRDGNSLDSGHLST
jgi:metal-sulfur cluster biosynthetic enzyme